MAAALTKTAEARDREAAAAMPVGASIISKER
jgi:hypothetical protein